MTENTQKYENWRAITESDYVTMFIKTWFAFVATLRELYPKENLDDIIGKGDKVFLNPYLDDFEDIYSFYNKIDNVRDELLYVYKLGREYTLKNKKYNPFFAKDFYLVNKSYLWQDTTDDYECSIKYSSDYVISIHIKYLNEDLFVDNKPLIIAKKINIEDLIFSTNLSDHQIQSFLDDEAAYINYVAREISNRVSIEFISEITNGDFKSKYTPKALAKLNAISLYVNTKFESSLLLIKDPQI